MSNNKGVFVAIQIVIEKLVFGGDGMGYLPDGRAVFVPYVIPGEEVAIEIITEKKHFARAKLVEIIKPSEKRVIPVCPFFGICGGCHYQQLSYPHQIAVKRDILIDQFQRFAGIHISELLQVFSADSNLDYRNKIQLHVNSAGRLGYQMAHSKTIVPVDECHLTVGDFQDLLELLNFEENTAVERVSCRWDSNGELLILLDSKSLIPPEMETDMGASIVHRSPAGEIVLAGDNCQYFEILDKSFSVSAGSFFQANTSQAEKMVSYLLENLSVSNDDILADLYCGVGLFSKFFAPKAKLCIGIESSSSAVADYAVNLDEFDNVRIYEGLTEKIFPFLDVQPDVVILDPPRAGLNVKVADALGKSDVNVIAYVSCDPSTLVRDIKRLQRHDFHIKSIALFDQFPQTYHIESICILERK